MTNTRVQQPASPDTEVAPDSRTPATAPLSGTKGEHPAIRLERLFSQASALGLRATRTMDGAARLLAVWASRDPAAATWILAPMRRAGDAVERLCRSAQSERPA